MSLPSHWEYEFENGDQEACFNPKSQSALRLSILKVTSPEGIPSEENIKSLTANQPYVIIPKGYLLTNPAYSETTDGRRNITLVTWRLINNNEGEKIIAILTYTVLSEEKDSTQEKEIFKLIENSLQSAVCQMIKASLG